MLRIALVANNFIEAKRFAQWKFRDKINEYNAILNKFILLNGDEIHLCYEEANKEKYLTMEYDAFIVSPLYKSLLDVIRYRSER